MLCYYFEVLNLKFVVFEFILLLFEFVDLKNLFITVIFSSLFHYNYISAFF